MNRIFLNILFIILSSVFSFGQTKSYIDKLVEIDSSIKANMELGNTEALGDLFYQRAINKIALSPETGDALQDLQTSATYARFLEDTLAFHKANVTIAQLYLSQEIYYDDAVNMLEDAINHYGTKGEPALEARAHTVLGNIYENKQQYELALENIRKALKINESVKDTILQLECNLLVSNLLSLNGNRAKAITLAENNLKLSQLLKEDFFIVENLLSLAKYHQAINQYKEGEEYLDENLIKSKGNIEQRSILYQLLSDYASAVGDMNSSFRYFKNHVEVKDSLQELRRLDLMNSMTFEARTRAKEREIMRLEEERKTKALELDQKNRLVMTLITGLIIGLLALFLIIRFYVQKIKASALVAEKQYQLDQQKIKDMENDFKIKNLESMVIGQEEERKRISTDLHDSLGGMLSTLKLQYDSLQLDHENLTSDKDYQGINEMIDTACDEVRNIARNLKPAALEKIGLKAALTDLVNRYKKYPDADISLHFHKTDKKLDYNTKVHVYRIIQELIHNAIKHSQCKELDIQISSMNDEFVVMVEDDGVGFDQKTAVFGHGIDNIKSRVNILKGEIQIDSKRDKGTSVIIHIPQLARAI